MKKLLSTILFLLPTLALAIDKPIPCTGNSCKLLFETTGSGGAKVSAGNVDGLGKWTIGPTASTQTNLINGRFLHSTVSTDDAGAIKIVNSNRSTSAFFGLERSTTGGLATGSSADALVIGHDQAKSIQFAPNQSVAGTITSAGDWTIGPAASGAYGTNVNHDMNGNILFSGGLGFYGRQTAGGGGNTCNTQCDSEPTGFNVASGKCLAGWNSSGSASDCTTTLVSGFCLCVGIQ